MEETGWAQPLPLAWWSPLASPLALAGGPGQARLVWEASVGALVQGLQKEGCVSCVLGGRLQRPTQVRLPRPYRTKKHPDFPSRESASPPTPPPRPPRNLGFDTVSKGPKTGVEGGCGPAVQRQDGQRQAGRAA